MRSDSATFLAHSFAHTQLNTSLCRRFDPPEGLTAVYDNQVVAVDNNESAPADGSPALRVNAMLTLSSGVPCAVYGVCAHALLKCAYVGHCI